MADVGHELAAIRFVVVSKQLKILSRRIWMFSIRKCLNFEIMKRSWLNLQTSVKGGKFWMPNENIFGLKINETETRIEKLPEIKDKWFAGDRNVSARNKFIARLHKSKSLVRFSSGKNLKNFNDLRWRVGVRRKARTFSRLVDEIPQLENDSLCWLGLGRELSRCISPNRNLFASRRQNFHFHLAWVNRRRRVRLIFRIPRRAWRQSPLRKSPRSRKRNDFLSSHREIASITRRGTKNIFRSGLICLLLSALVTMKIFVFAHFHLVYVLRWRQGAVFAVLMSPGRMTKPRMWPLMAANVDDEPNRVSCWEICFASRASCVIRLECFIHEIAEISPRTQEVMSHKQRK